RGLRNQAQDADRRGDADRAAEERELYNAAAGVSSVRSTFASLFLCETCASSSVHLPLNATLKYVTESGIGRSFPLASACSRFLSAASCAVIWAARAAGTS